jgi:N-methylhydantoinase A
MKHEFTYAMHVTERTVDYDKLNKNFEELIDRAVTTLKEEGIRENEIVIRKMVDVKYFSQSRFLTIDAPPGEIRDMKYITESFLKAMEAEYGYVIPPEYDEVEIVNLRIEAIGIIPKPELSKIERKGRLEDAMKKPRKVWFRETGFIDSSIYERDRLPTGLSFRGPAIIEQPDTTTVMPPNTECVVDPYGNLVISILRE